MSAKQPELPFSSLLISLEGEERIFFADQQLLVTTLHYEFVWNRYWEGTRSSTVPEDLNALPTVSETIDGVEDSQTLQLIRDCVAEDEATRLAARVRFQIRYGETTYNWCRRYMSQDEWCKDIRRKRHLSLDEQVSDFYAYLLIEKGILYSRMQSFKNTCPFEAFLRSILFIGMPRLRIPSMLREWLREGEKKKEPDCYSLDTPQNSEDQEGPSRRDLVQDRDLPWVDEEPEEYAGREAEYARRIVAALEPRDRLLLKLLYLIENQLEDADYAELAKWSNWPEDEVRKLVEQVCDALTAKDENLSTLRDRFVRKANDVANEKLKLQQIQAKISPLSPMPADGKRLHADYAKTTERYHRLCNELEGIREEIRRCNMNTSTEDLARLLNVKPGTAGARVAHLRAQVREKWEACMQTKGGVR